MHGVLRLNDAMAAGWTDEDVVRRWGRLFPPRGKNRVALPVTDAWVAAQLAKAAWVAETRKRLNSLGWFMKCLKEPLSRRANREDQCRGTFFEARFKSIAILDEEALLTTLAYVDLNPLSAGLAATPEDSPYTSVKARVDHCRDCGTLEAIVGEESKSVSVSESLAGTASEERAADVDRASESSSACRVQNSHGSGPKGAGRRVEGHDRPSGSVVEDESFWLVPIQERREFGGQRAGISTGISLKGYLELLDWSGRLLRGGKSRIPADVAGILDRLGSSPDVWQHRLEKLCETDRLFGVVFSTQRRRIRELAASRGVRKLSNLNGCSG